MGFVLFLFADLFGQNIPIADLVERQMEQGIEFVEFNLVQEELPKPSGVNTIFKESAHYELNRQEWETILRTQPEEVAIQLPTYKQNISLQLVRHEVLTSDFTMVTNESNNRPVKYTPGVYYRGIVSGSPNSFAAMSFFNDEVMGVIHLPHLGNFVLGKIQEDNVQEHIGYYESDMLITSSFSCNSPDDNFSQSEIDELRELASTVTNSLVDKCVDVYLELEYDLVHEKGGATGAANFITGLYNVVALLYQNETITTNISQLFVWSTPDAYPTSTTLAALNSFKATRPSYNGDLAHLISRGAPSGGGIAWVNGLCNNFGYAYSYVHSSYNQYPTYSWSVNVVAHEMGHNLGSPHTHACSWNGGAIDGCGPTAGYSEGCNAPLPGPNQGTIMSYCHLLSNVGIGHTYGFGPQPGNLIRSRINSAGCLNVCETCPGTLSLSGTISNTQNYEASNFVTSSQNLTTSANVNYKGGNLVILTNGFFAATGSDLRAYIGDCSSSINDNQESIYYEENEQQYTNFSNVRTEAESSELRCYPNPFRDKIIIEFMLETSTDVTLSIADISGKTIKQLLVNEPWEFGVHLLEFDGSNLPEGIYLCRLQTKDKVHIQQMVLVR